MAVELTIKDIDGTDKGFFPVNYFSPNDDGINDYYAMELKNFETGELENILPLDNCASQFQAIRIYNRWGKTVFESTDRNFKWFGKGEPAGVYFYLIEYSSREYKGSLSIRY
jgi:gliding motility-associated-like protein